MATPGRLREAAMNPKKLLVIIGIILAFIILVCFGCYWGILIPAPKRDFTSADLLITEAELPEGWTIPEGFLIHTDTRRPRGSMRIGIFTSPESPRSNISQYAFIYPFMSRAKRHFREDTFSETSITGWNFTSNYADEEHFWCRFYRDSDDPICTWEARYQEILIEIIGRLDPQYLSLEDMQLVAALSDKKVIQTLYGIHGE